jgi:hypothetical protein
VKIFSQYIRAIKTSGLALLVVYFLYTLFDQILTSLMEQNLRSPDGADFRVFIYGAVYLANSILFTTMAILVALYGVTQKKAGLIEFLKKYFSQSCIEVLRSWGKTLLWSLLLIVPGILKYLQFIFVPFVVALYPAYDEGRVDALATSKALFKKHWGKVLLALMTFQVIWTSFSTAVFDSVRLFSTAPLPALLITCLEALVFLLYILVLFGIYIRSSGEVKHESIV